MSGTQFGRDGATESALTVSQARGSDVPGNAPNALSADAVGWPATAAAISGPPVGSPSASDGPRTASEAKGGASGRGFGQIQPCSQLCPANRVPPLTGGGGAGTQLALADTNRVRDTVGTQLGHSRTQLAPEGASCVKCGSPTPPSDLLCRACYEARRPPVCPACGGRLVGGKCGWC